MDPIDGSTGSEWEFGLGLLNFGSTPGMRACEPRRARVFGVRVRDVGGVDDRRGGDQSGLEALVEGAIFARPANRRKQQRWRLSGGGGIAGRQPLGRTQMHQAMRSRRSGGAPPRLNWPRFYWPTPPNWPGIACHVGGGEIGEIDGSTHFVVCFPPPHFIIMPCGFWGGGGGLPRPQSPSQALFLICSPQ